MIQQTIGQSHEAQPGGQTVYGFPPPGPNQPDQQDHRRGHQQKGLLAKHGAARQQSGGRGPAAHGGPEGPSGEKDAVHRMPGHMRKTVHAPDEAAGSQQRQGQTQGLQAEEPVQKKRREPGSRQHARHETGLARQHVEVLRREPHPESMPVQRQSGLDVIKIPIGHLPFQNAPGITVKIAEIRGIHAVGRVEQQIGQRRQHGGGPGPDARLFPSRLRHCCVFLFPKFHAARRTTGPLLWQDANRPGATACPLAHFAGAS